MPKLTILRGVSGSGKSTWAEAQKNVVVVSRDRLRESLFGTSDQPYYQCDKAVLKRKEDFVTKVEHEAVASALKAGMDVISDNTNVRPKYMKGIADIGFKAGAQVEVKVFDVDLKTAIQRNELRHRMGGRLVPTTVISEQHAALRQTLDAKVVPPALPKPYHGTPGKPETVLVDIDGTLAHMRDKRGPFDWLRVGVDEVDEVVANLVRTLYVTDHTIVIMSGRDAVSREETVKWLAKHNIPYDALFMRAEKDMRKDSIIKAELFDNHVRDNYDVKFVLDDRNQVVDMWRSMGIKTLQVAEGDF